MEMHVNDLKWMKKHIASIPLQVFIDHLQALLVVVSNTICKSESAYNRLEALLTSSEVMPSMP